MKRFLSAITIFAVLTISCSKGNSTDEPLTDAQLQVTVLAEGLDHPWEILWGPDNMLWMTERSGRISQLDPQSGSIKNLITISDVRATGEGGLLGMALHPDFQTTPHVFVAYNYDKSGRYTEKVVRYTFNGTTLVDPVIILDNIAAAGIHNGARLVFGPDKKLYITTGDAGTSSSSQQASSVNGKVLRLNPDGTVPADNPNGGSPIWSTGHRNAQGPTFANGKLYSSEHGPSTDDEINIIQSGMNYGWPNVAGACDESAEQTFCNSNAVVTPIYSWTPTIAPSGMEYYNNDLIPQWKNSLLVAVLKNSMLVQLKLNGAGDQVESVTEFFKGEYGRMRDVCVAPDGRVFISTDNGSDRILVVSRSN